MQIKPVEIGIGINGTLNLNHTVHLLMLCYTHSFFKFCLCLHMQMFDAACILIFSLGKKR